MGVIFSQIWAEVDNLLLLKYLTLAPTRFQVFPRLCMMQLVVNRYGYHIEL